MSHPFDVSNAKKLMNPLVTLIPLKYLDALSIFNSKLEGKGIGWAISGNLGEVLRTVHVEPDGIDILTNKEGATQIFQAVHEFNPSKLRWRTKTLSRPAVVGAKEYPVNIRSYYFEFEINSIKVRVYGDLQIQIGDWEWGDKIEFEPDYVYVVSQKMRVAPLQLKYDLYRGLGWMDRAEKIMPILYRRRRRIKSR
jgi:hypothetical protein